MSPALLLFLKTWANSLPRLARSCMAVNSHPLTWAAPRPVGSTALPMRARPKVPMISVLLSGRQSARKSIAVRSTSNERWRPPFSSTESTLVQSVAVRRSAESL